MGQYETNATTSINNIFYQNSITNSDKFLQRFSGNYTKCALLIPSEYINEFKEIVEFPNNHPIFGLIQNLSKTRGIVFSEFKDISEILQFFKDG